MSIFVAVTTPKAYDCAAHGKTTVQPGLAASAAAAAASSRAVYVLGPAAFEPSDDDALSCPLFLSAADGQHINLTLYDFGVTSRRGGDDAAPVDDFSGYDQVRLSPPTVRHSPRTPTPLFRAGGHRPFVGGPGFLKARNATGMM